MSQQSTDEMSAAESPDIPNNSTGDRSREELDAELTLLREQNRSLKQSYVQAQRTQHQRTAIALAGLGLAAILGGVVVPGVREILLAFGAIGLFGGVLTYYLTPEQFVAANIGTAVYNALATDRSAIVDELGLSEAQVYVPTGAQQTRVRLFLPQSSEYTLPDTDALRTTFVVPENGGDRGVAVRPTGETLYDSFEETVTGSVSDSPPELATQLSEALVEQFDLVTQTRMDSDPEHDRLTVAVDESVYGPVDRIDHPVASFLAVGLARGLGTPVSVTTDTLSAESDLEFQVTLRWD